jgi:hypothetical protein
VPAEDAALLFLVERFKREAQAAGRTLALIGHVCGTDGDPQDKAAQVRQLEGAGALIVGSNVEAAEVQVDLPSMTGVPPDLVIKILICLPGCLPL